MLHSMTGSMFIDEGVLGAWLSWLERRVHIAEIAGSIPAAPIAIFEYLQF